MAFEAKLTPEQKAAIVNNTEDTARSLAEKYDVTKQTIYNLRQQAKAEAKQKEREAAESETSRVRQGTIRDLSEWDDKDYTPTDGVGRLDVPAEIIPDGIEYQWCTCMVFGQPWPQRVSEWQRQGWKSVPSERHPGRWTPLGFNGNIEVDGLTLMERPKSWCDRARAHDQNNARRQMAAKKMQFQGGDLPGVTLDSQHPSALRTNTMRSEFQRITVPEE